MPNSLVSAWREILAKLSTIARLQQGGPSAEAVLQRNVQQAHKLLQEVGGLPKQRAATWRKVILDVQVLQQLGVLWWSTSDPGTAMDPSNDVFPFLFMNTVVTFLKAALQGNPCLQPVPFDMEPNSNAGEGKDSLRAAMQQQLVQSGLVDGLTQLIEATAQQLESFNAADTMSTAEACANSSSSSSSSGGGGGSRRSRSSCGSSSSRCQSQAAGQVVNVRLIDAVGSCIEALGDFIDDPTLEPFKGFEAASMHLVVATVQHISLSLQQQQEQPEEPGHSLPAGLTAFAMSAVEAMSALANHVHRLGASVNCCGNAKALVGAEHCMAWNALTVVVAAYAEVLWQKQCLPQVQGLGSAYRTADSGSSVPSTTHSSSTTSSSNASSSSSTTTKAASQGGGRSADRQQQAAGLYGSLYDGVKLSKFDQLAGQVMRAWQEVQGQWSSLPPSHTKLLEQLGCSVPAAVWLAAIVWLSRQAGLAVVKIQRCTPQIVLTTVMRSAIDDPCRAPLEVVVPPCPLQQGSESCPEPCFEGSHGIQSFQPGVQPQTSTSNTGAQWAQHVADRCKLDSMLSAVLLYAVVHVLTTPEAGAKGGPNQPQAADTVHAIALAAETLVDHVAAVLQEAGTGVNLCSFAEADELLLLCLKALECLHYPEAAVSSEVSGVQATRAAAAAPGQTARTGAGGKEAAALRRAAASRLVQVLCTLVGAQMTGLCPRPMLGHTAHASSIPNAARCTNAVEPCSQGPAATVAPVSSASQALAHGGPPTLVNRAAAMCRVLEAFVRQLAGYNHVPDLPPPYCWQEDDSASEAAVSDMVKVCSISQPQQQGDQPLPALAAATGPGSKLQVQLFSLWSSLLKLPQTRDSIVQRLNLTQTDGSSSLVKLPAQCALTAVFLVEYLAPGKSRSVTALDATTLQNSSAVVAGAPSRAAEPPAPDTVLSGKISTSSVNSSVTGTTRSFAQPCLMWTMLLGRCCLHWAGAIAGAHEAGCSITPIAGVQSAGPANTSGGLANSLQVLRLVVEKVQVILGPNSSMAQQLSDCGYNIALVTDKAGAALAALGTAEQAPDSDSRAAEGSEPSGPELEAAVKALGEALTSLAAPYSCNNPHCLNISGPSDVALVSGKSCICGKCKVARYCGKACQQQHWRLHKPVCKALAAAQQAAGSACTGIAVPVSL